MSEQPGDGQGRAATEAAAEIESGDAVDDAASATCAATCAPTTGTSRPRTWSRPGRSGSPRSRPSRPSSPRTGRRAGPWSGSAAGTAAACAAGPGRRSTSSPTTCRSWSTRSRWSWPGTAATTPGRAPAAARPPGRHRVAARGARAWSTGNEPAARRARRVVDAHRDRQAGRGRGRRAAAGPAAGARRRPGGGRGLDPDAGQGRPAGRPAGLVQPTSGSPTAPDARAPSRRPEVEALLRWLADGHFTFLGYREYDLEAGPDGMTLRAVPGTGLGILRHDRPGIERVRGAAPRGAGPGPRPAPADPDQGELALDRAPAQLPRLRRGQAAGRGREGGGRVPVPRPVHPRRLHREHHQDPGAAAQADRRARGHAASPRTATTARTWPSSWRSTRARSCSRPRRRSWPRSPRACSGCASAGRPGCSCARTSTAGTCPAWSTCPGTGTPPRSGCASRRSCARP